MEIDLEDVRNILADRIKRVEAGDRITIMQNGKAVAHLIAVEPNRKKINGATLRALTASMPKDATGVVRTMRDEDRY